jgi:ankyrin repeat protein
MRLTVEMAGNLGRFCNKLATAVILALVFFSPITLANPMDQYPLHTAAKQNNVTEVERLLSASCQCRLKSDPFSSEASE